MRRRGRNRPAQPAFLRKKKLSCVTFKKHTLLPLDDCLYALQASIPHLTRSSLHRLFRRHGISRLPNANGAKPTKKFKTYPIGYVHVDIAEGVNGLSNRKPWGPARRLTPAQEDTFARWVEGGPNREADGVARWRRKHLQRKLAATFGVEFH